VVPLGGPYAQYVRAPFAYARRFRDWDVLIDIDNGVPFFSVLWHRGPVICLVHHLSKEQWHLRFPRPVASLGRMLEERAMPRAYRRSLFLCISRSTGSAVRELGVPDDRIRLMTMGTPGIPGADSSRSSEPLFLALGRLVPYKRLDVLLRIWQTVHAEVGGRLVVAGDGPERPRLEQIGGEGVDIRGRVSEEEKQSLLRSSWLLVHSALHEGWGMVVSEAAHAGTPTLAFDVPGIRDSVFQGETGVLVSSESEFAAEWIALARDPERREKMGAAATLRAQEVPWEATVDTFLSVIEEAIQRRD
jgi:glycosyltransferase involved in cell wall biosynthesis